VDLTDRGPGQVAAQDLIAQVPAEQWLRINAGDGSKGKRLYDWTRVPLWRWGWPAYVGFWLQGPWGLARTGRPGVRAGWGGCSGDDAIRPPLDAPTTGNNAGTATVGLKRFARSGDSNTAHHPEGHMRRPIA
jgi:hypothetical protein